MTPPRRISARTLHTLDQPRMNSGLISFARMRRMRACSSMSAHSAIRKNSLRVLGIAAQHAVLQLGGRLMHRVVGRIVELLEQPDEFVRLPLLHAEVVDMQEIPLRRQRLLRHRTLSLNRLTNFSADTRPHLAGQAMRTPLPEQTADETTAPCRRTTYSIPGHAIHGPPRADPACPTESYTDDAVYQRERRAYLPRPHLELRRAGSRNPHHRRLHSLQCWTHASGRRARARTAQST